MLQKIPFICETDNQVLNLMKRRQKCIFSPPSNSILQKSNQPNVKRIVKFNTTQHTWGIVDIEVTQPLIESILQELIERTI